MPDPNQIHVRAARGALFPHAAPRAGFVGYRLADPDDDADHVVPGGQRYTAVSDGELVADSAYYRRALRRGDIEQVEEPAADEDADADAPSDDAPSHEDASPETTGHLTESEG